MSVFRLQTIAATGLVACAFLAVAVWHSKAQQPGQIERRADDKTAPLGVCMNPGERLDLALALIGRELTIFLQQCLKSPGELSDQGRAAAEKLISVPKERKDLLQAAGAVALQAFTRAIPTGGKELFGDLIASYSGTIEQGIGTGDGVDRAMCAQYFEHMAATLTGPREALSAVVIFRAGRFKKMFPDCREPG